MVKFQIWLALVVVVEEFMAGGGALWTDPHWRWRWSRVVLGVSARRRGGDELFIVLALGASPRRRAVLAVPSVGRRG